MKPHIAYVMRVCAAAYANWSAKMDADSAEVWSRLLEDIDPDDLSTATMRFVRKSKFPPTPADLIELSKAARSDRLARIASAAPRPQLEAPREASEEERRAGLALIRANLAKIGKQLPYQAPIRGPI